MQPQEPQPALVAVSYATKDKLNVGPIIELLLLQLSDEQREFVYFLPYADVSMPDVSISAAEHLKRIYSDAHLVVVFYSASYNTGVSLEIQTEEAAIIARCKDKNKPCLFLSLDNTSQSRGNDFSSANFESCVSLTRPRIAAKITRKLVALQAGFTARPLDNLRTIWAPGLSGFDDETSTAVRYSLTASTAVSCQTQWWMLMLNVLREFENTLRDIQQLAPPATGAKEENSLSERDAKSKLERVAMMSNKFFKCIGGLGLSATRVVSGHSPLGFLNTLSKNRSEPKSDHIIWRATARIESLLELQQKRADLNEEGIFLSGNEVDATLESLMASRDHKKLRKEWDDDPRALLERLQSLSMFMQTLRIATSFTLSEMNKQCGHIAESAPPDELAALKKFLSPVEISLPDYALWT